MAAHVTTRERAEMRSLAKDGWTTMQIARAFDRHWLTAFHYVHDINLGRRAREADARALAILEYAESGKTYPQIGARFGMTPGTAKVSVFKARRRVIARNLRKVQ